MVATSKVLSAAIALAPSVTIAVYTESHPHQYRQKSILGSGHGHVLEAATAAGGMAVASYVASEVASARSSSSDKETKKTDGDDQVCDFPKADPEATDFIQSVLAYLPNVNQPKPFADLVSLVRETMKVHTEFRLVSHSESSSTINYIIDIDLINKL